MFIEMRQDKVKSIAISWDNSLILKGVGIILMLIHHLFYSEYSRALYDDVAIRGYGLVNQIGLYGKLCVAIFVFVSGYGLAKSYGTDFDWKAFYRRRFKKLYFNYWFIWLVFVPIGVFVFHRTFAEAYGDHILVKFVLEFLGMLNLTGLLGYNPTWWFYSCIILLYALYPVLAKNYDRYLLGTVSTILPLSWFIVPLRPISHYLLPFIAGMYVARKEVRCSGTWGTLLAIILLSVFRNISGNLVFIIDTLLCIGLASLLSVVEVPEGVKAVFKSLGKHSMNIFLFHTFIYHYWFENLVYATRNPLMIFLSLIIPCWVISCFLEFVKDRLGFYHLCK